MNKLKLSLTCLSIFICFALCFSADPAAKVTPFVDFNYTASDVYSGYLSLPTANKKLFYVLVEAQKSKDTAPLVIWLNGGPGCSSLAGLFTEIGPMIFDQNQRLVSNPNTWVENANVLFLESPAGVGFSTGDDLTSNDEISAQDNLSALVAFLSSFGEYKTRDLYIAGESYAGVYIPQLATKILNYNLTTPTPINLKGLLIGNPVTDWTEDGERALIDQAWAHTLYPFHLRIDYLNKCSDVYESDDCKKSREAIYSKLQGIYMYDLFSKCAPSATDEKLTFPKDANSFITILTKLNTFCGGNPDSGITGFLNKANVKDAFHANAATTWSQCNMDLQLKYYTMSNNASLYLYKNLIGQRLKIWIFSGNFDLVIPYNSTRRWIKKLNLPLIRPWSRWGKEDRHFFYGYLEQYAGISFITVRNSGHMVPSEKGVAAKKLFNSFVQNVDLE